MTYCVALKVSDGMVFLADTRTNAGVDNVSRVKKLFTWELEDRVLVMMTAGNLGMTQAVISELNEQLEREQPGDVTLANAESMFYVAQLVGSVMLDVQNRFGPSLSARGVDGSSSIILGGQRRGGTQRLFHIYPEGNFIEAVDDTPFFQIGENKYGKPIIDRVITPDTELQDAIICALLSMDSTIRSNLSVGMPLDLAVLRKDTFSFEQERRIESEDDSYRAFSEAWSQQLRDGFAVMRQLRV